MRCNIEVHSLKLTGNEILVRSLPTEPLRIDHTAGQYRNADSTGGESHVQLTEGRLSSSMGNLLLTRI